MYEIPTEGRALCGTRIYDEYSRIAPPPALYAHYKLDADGIRDLVWNQINKTGGQRPSK